MNARIQPAAEPLSSTHLFSAVITDLLQCRLLLRRPLARLAALDQPSVGPASAASDCPRLGDPMRSVRKGPGAGGRWCMPPPPAAGRVLLPPVALQRQALPRSRRSHSACSGRWKRTLHPGHKVRNMPWHLPLGACRHCCQRCLPARRTCLLLSHPCSPPPAAKPSCHTRLSLTLLQPWAREVAPLIRRCSGQMQRGGQCGSGRNGGHARSLLERVASCWVHPQIWMLLCAEARSASSWHAPCS